MLLAWLRKLLRIAPRWPQGAPFMAGDVRIGTILPDGSILLAPGFTFAPGSQASSGQQQLDHSGHSKNRAEASSFLPGGPQ